MGFTRPSWPRSLRPGQACGDSARPALAQPLASVLKYCLLIPALLTPLLIWSPHESHPEDTRHPAQAAPPPPHPARPRPPLPRHRPRRAPDQRGGARAHRAKPCTDLVKRGYLQQDPARGIEEAILHIGDVLREVLPDAQDAHGDELPDLVTQAPHGDDTP